MTITEIKPEPTVTQEEIDLLLNPDDFSGRQRKAMNAIDDKNIDEQYLAQLFLNAYQKMKAKLGH